MKDKTQKICCCLPRISPEVVGRAASGRYAGWGIAAVENVSIDADQMEVLVLFEGVI